LTAPEGFGTLLAILARRHGVAGCQEALKKVAGALTRFAREATKK
jgi:hypothetical protein